MITTELTDAEKVRGLRWIIASDSTSCVFCQLTVFGSAFILFLDELGLAKRQIGFLLSLFPFCGLIALFVAPVVARAGFKSVFLVFWGARKVIIGFLLLTPWILAHFGFEGAFIYVAAVLAAFAICRAIAETALYPWLQEVVPDAIRGKFTAVDNMVSISAGIIAVGAASYVVGHYQGLGRYMWLIGVAVAFGMMSVASAFSIPGGAPLRSRSAPRTHFVQVTKALQDRNFLLFLGGLGLTELAWAPLVSFVPLFVKEQVGLGSGEVVRLQTLSLLGGLLSSYLWGWWADRHGSKRVILSSLLIAVLIPVCWMLIPRNSAWSDVAAMSISFIGGVCSMGMLVIGANRLLYVSVVPPRNKTEYMAVFYAWMGLTAGLGPLLAGRAVDYCRGVSGKFSAFTLDPYTLLFAASLVAFILAMAFYARVRDDSWTMPKRLITRSGQAP